MLSKAIDNIVSLVNLGRKPEFVEVDGRCYSNIRLNPVMEPEPSPLYLSTLSALVDYVANNPDSLEGYFINIVEPVLVELRSSLSRQFQQRSCYIGSSIFSIAVKII